MINFRKIFRSASNPSVPPQSHTAKVLCPDTNKKESITFTQHSVEYPNVTLFYYMCEKERKCEKRKKCTYLSQKEYYKCHFCETLTTGSPRYNLHPISRTCHKCGKNLMRKIPPNYRRQPHGRH